MLVATKLAPTFVRKADFAHNLLIHTVTYVGRARIRLKIWSTKYENIICVLDDNEASFCVPDKEILMSVLIMNASEKNSCSQDYLLKSTI